MDSVTLRLAKRIIDEIHNYTTKISGTPDFEHLTHAVQMSTGATAVQVAETLEFMQYLSSGQSFLPAVQRTKDEVMAEYSSSSPFNLGSEITFNYNVAKTLLIDAVGKDTKDNEDIRKTLREISRMIDSMLKAQERMINVQNMQNFQETVLEVIESVDKPTKDAILDALQKADL